MRRISENEKLGNHVSNFFVKLQNGQGTRPVPGGASTPRTRYIQTGLDVQEFVMAPRAYWKGFLRLSLVSCPIQLFPATSEREKVSFNQINQETGNRIRYRKVDDETGEEVPNESIIKGYQVD